MNRNKYHKIQKISTPDFQQIQLNKVEGRYFRKSIKKGMRLFYLPLEHKKIRKHRRLSFYQKLKKILAKGMAERKVDDKGCGTRGDWAWPEPRDGKISAVDFKNGRSLQRCERYR